MLDCEDSSLGFRLFPEQKKWFKDAMLYESLIVRNLHFVSIFWHFIQQIDRDNVFFFF